MNTPLVSIIVPIYNTAEYVEECIQSILSQSYKNMELILVNDGSTDGSGEICRHYAHLPVIYYIEQENQGVTAARKCGVEAARGEWIMFVDSDDMLLPDAINNLVYKANDCDIVISRHSKSNALLSAPDFYSWEDYLYRVYSISTSVSPCAKLFRKELILNSPLAFRFDLSKAEDHPMNLAIAVSNRKSVAICKEAVFFYRQRPGSRTHSLPFTFDLCYHLCNANDAIVGNNLSYKEKLNGGINQRMHYYHFILHDNDYQGNKNHPFVRETIKRMNEAKVLRLSDRLILSVSSKTTVKICLFLSKLLRRIEKPSLIVRDFQRSFKRASV